MRTKWLSTGLTLALLSLAGTAAQSAELRAQAKITRAVAEMTALSRVPRGQIKEGELEKEHGKLVWSFDIAQPASRDIIEVHVDAINGKIVSQETETPADQAKEAAKDRAMAGKKPAS